MSKIHFTSNDLFQLIPQDEFKKILNYWEPDKGVKKFSTTVLTKVMLASVIYDWKNLRDIEEAVGVKKSTLCDALAKRPFAFFNDLFNIILKEIKLLTNDRKVKTALRDLLAIDSSGCRTNASLRKYKQYRAQDKKASTKFHAVFNVMEEIIEDYRITGHRSHDLTVAKTIELRKNVTYVFDRAYVDLKYWLSINKAGSYFVSRLKKSPRKSYIHEAKLDPFTGKVGVLLDGEWTPNEATAYANKLKPKELKFRHVIYKDPKTKRIFDFVTNDRLSSAQEIADIYRKRWAVETLFKWMKTHFNLRKTTMRNRNAIKIQIISGVIAQILLRLKIIKENISAITTASLLRKFRQGIYTMFFIIGENTANYGSTVGKT